MSQTQVAAKPIAAKPSAAVAPSESLVDDLKRTFSRDNDQMWAGVAISGLIAVLVYSYLNTLSIAAAFWETSQYSFGWMVPLFSIAVIWMWWQPIKSVSVRDRWLGVAVISAALLFRVTVSYFAYKVPDMWSFVIAVAGVFLLVGGWPTLRWAAGPIAFLLFMLPLPMKVYAFLFLRLQSFNTVASVWLLQTLGISAYAEGNKIQMGQQQLEVAEACSGMGMGTMLPAMCVAFVMVVPMQWWKRAIIVVTSLPIACATNLVRIVGTSLLMKFNWHFEWIDPSNQQATNFWFHTVFGYIIMLPVAFGLLYLLWVILNHLFITVEESRPAPVAMRPPRVRMAVPK